MQRENKCHCSQTDRLHRIDSNYKNHTPDKCWTERENKWQDRWEDSGLKERITDVEMFAINHGFAEWKGQSIPKFIQSEIDRAVAEERKKWWDNSNGLVSLFGAILMSNGIFGVEKEELKSDLARALKEFLNK